MATEVERIAALEVQFTNLVKAQEAHTQEQHSMNKKLDDLLALRNKGVGAFWLATSLAGAGAISICIQILHWFGVKFGS